MNQNNLDSRLVELVRNHSGYKQITADTDIIDDIGIVGDDLQNLLRKVIEIFGTDMSELYLTRHGDVSEAAATWSLLILPFTLLKQMLLSKPRPEHLPLRMLDLQRAIETGRLSTKDIESSILANKR